MSLVASESECAFTANTDLYGIGIRVGIYCQWMAAFIARTLAMDEQVVTSIQDAATCFQAAIVATLLLIITTQSQPLLQPEMLIAFALCFGGFAIANTPPMVLGQAKSQEISLIRLLFSLHLFGLLAGISSWFWWHGLDTKGSHPVDCAYLTFLFARLTVQSLEGFFRAMSVISCIIFLIAELAIMVPLVKAVLRTPLSEVLGAFINARISDMASEIQSAWLSRIVLLLCTVLVAFLMVIVELTLSWNMVKDVNQLDNVGQLVPLFVGGFGLVKTVFYGLRQGFRHRRFDEGLDPLDFPLQLQ